MTPPKKLRSIADSTGLDGIADAIREIANEIEHNNAPALPVAWWIPKAEQFCLAKPSGERPFAKAWEPLYAAAPAVAALDLDEIAGDVRECFGNGVGAYNAGVDAMLDAVKRAMLAATPTPAPAPVDLTDEAVNDAARVLAERFDYPWEHMPEEGRKNMRVQARAVVEAALRAKGAV